MGLRRAARRFRGAVGDREPPEVHGERYAVVIGWSALGGEEPEEMEGVIENSRIYPHTIVVIRFLHVVDSDAAAALEAAAGRVCTSQVRAGYHKASLLRHVHT